MEEIESLLETVGRDGRIVIFKRKHRYDDRYFKKYFKILSTIFLKGRKTAYRLHKETGYPLSSVQYILKDLQDERFIDVVEHQERKPGQLERKFYDMKLYGVATFLLKYIRSDAHISFLDTLGLPNFLEIIERGAKTEERGEDDYQLQIIRTAIEMDEWVKASEENRERCRKYGYNLYDFTIKTLSFYFSFIVPFVSVFDKEVRFQLQYQRVKYGYPPTKEGYPNAIEIVLWKCGLFDKLFEECSILAKEAEQKNNELSEVYKDLIPEDLF